ncbi:hypothetical protein SNE40_017365 [Patella caerulea]|uniref:Uncharacterized protein n=1 Tax=Patella caerulea TaxID=87958 RepID=A0AAN8PFN7_PATCE
MSDVLADGIPVLLDVRCSGEVMSDVLADGIPVLLDVRCSGEVMSDVLVDILADGIIIILVRIINLM